MVPKIAHKMKSIIWKHNFFLHISLFVLNGNCYEITMNDAISFKHPTQDIRAKALLIAHWLIEKILILMKSMFPMNWKIFSQNWKLLVLFFLHSNSQSNRIESNCTKKESWYYKHIKRTIISQSAWPPLDEKITKLNIANVWSVMYSDIKSIYRFSPNRSF